LHNLFADMLTPTPLALATLSGVIICWMIFAGTFLFRKKPPRAPETQRDKRATLGVVLQMVGYFLVFFQPPRRPFLPPIPTLSGTVGIIFSVFTVGLAAASVWLVASSVRLLGRQWAVPARLVEDHKLITVGPYSCVRNPIYTGMFGMLIATGLATEHWIALLAAVVAFGVGLVIRVRIEEKLLRAAFRDEFEDYARRVPALLPGIY
jgi:protein-S-isoprenylcysteine O-methyltransferase Ste14